MSYNNKFRKLRQKEQGMTAVETDSKVSWVKAVVHPILVKMTKAVAVIVTTLMRR